MKYNHTFRITILLLICFYAELTAVKAQSISQHVFPTAGGYQSNAAGSLSFTIGGTITQTATSSIHMLTQGFQQPNELKLLHVKAFLQGYYVGGGLMNDVLLNQGVTSSPGIYTDTFRVELHDANAPYSLLFATNELLQQDGNMIVRGLGVEGQSYFVVLKHRSGMETWSSTPVLIGQQSVYDFSTAASQAYGDNQAEVEPGIFALYTGDINQDGFIDSFDFPALDTDIFNGVTSVYVNTDLNGDGFVDGFDFPFLDINSFNGASVMAP